METLKTLVNDTIDDNLKLNKKISSLEGKKPNQYR